MSSWLRTALLGAIAFTPISASALESLTGNYEGTIVCDLTDETGSSHAKSDAALAVDDHGAGDAFAYLNNSGLVFRLTVVSDPAAPQQGRVGGPDCTFDSATGGALIQAVVKAKPGSDKGSLKGEFLSLGVGGAPHLVQVCRLKLRRTSTTIAAPIADCPF